MQLKFVSTVFIPRSWEVGKGLAMQAQGPWSWSGTHIRTKLSSAYPSRSVILAPGTEARGSLELLLPLSSLAS